MGNSAWHFKAGNKNAFSVYNKLFNFYPAQ